MREAIVFLILAICVAGCGGNSSDNPGAPTNVVFRVSWPERSRQFLAPLSAQSARMTLSDADVSTPDIVITQNRSDNNSAYEGTALSSEKTIPTKYRAQVDFYSQTNGEGAKVASAEVDTRLGSDGELLRVEGIPLGPVAYTGEVASVYGTVPNFVKGEPQYIGIGALNKQNQFLALSPEAFQVEVSSGTGFFARQSDGTFVSQQTGGCTVRLIVDGVTSIPYPVYTVSALRLPFKVRALHTSRGGQLFIALQNENVVIKVDPSTGEEMQRFATGGIPGTMGVSFDERFVHVALFGLSLFQTIDLVEGTVSPVRDFSSVFGTYAEEITCSPVNSQTFVLRGVGGEGYLVNNGEAVYDEEAPFSGRVQFSTSGVGLEYFGTSVRQLEIGDSGFFIRNSLNEISGDALASVGSSVVFTSGLVIDADALTKSRLWEEYRYSQIVVDATTGQVYGRNLNGLVRKDVSTGATLGEAATAFERETYSLGLRRIAQKTSVDAVSIYSDLP
jgi:hypothetical protein